MWALAFHDRDVEHRVATAADSGTRSAWRDPPRGKVGQARGRRWGLRTVRPMLSEFDIFSAAAAATRLKSGRHSQTDEGRDSWYF